MWRAKAAVGETELLDRFVQNEIALWHKRGEFVVGAFADLIAFSREPGETTLSLEQVIVRGQPPEERPLVESS